VSTAARLLAGVLLLAPFAAQALPEQTWLVAVGNNHGARDEVGLLYAERDAREFSEILRQHGRLSSRRTTLLLNDDAESMRRTLQEVNASIRNRASKGEQTALVVFYSGHADAEALHLGDSRFALDELRTLIEGSPASMRLLIVDACRSGTVTRVKGVAAAEPFRIDLRDDVTPEGVAIITSSAAGESSQESDQLQGSFFTHHFVNALRGAADRNGDGQVTLAEAYGYAYTQTLRSSGQTNALQHPTYAWSVKGRDQLILTSPAETQGRLGRLRLRAASNYLIMEKRDGGPVVAEVSPPADRTELVLPAGEYFVQQREKTEYRESQVTLTSGGLVDLANVSHRSVRYDRLVRRRGGPISSVSGVTLLAGMRGETVDGEGATPQFQLGYGKDFEWGSAGLRVRTSSVSGLGGDGLLPQRHTEAGLGLTMQRYIDFGRFSLAFGVLMEAVYHRQVFGPERGLEARNSWGAGFGGLFAGETQLGHGFMFRLEGGPVTSLFRKANVEEGAQVGSSIATPLTWSFAGGLVWRR
jgi:hypothetical protein